MSEQMRQHTFCARCGALCSDRWDLAGHLVMAHDASVGGAALALGLLDDDDGAWVAVRPRPRRRWSGRRATRLLGGTRRRGYGGPA